MLYIEPQSGVAPIVHMISQARTPIEAGVYYLTDRPILRALEQARKRGIPVRIMVEKKPYGMRPAMVSREVRTITRDGFQFRYAPARFTSHGRDWSFMHAKYLVDGQEAEIGNPNFAWSDFHRSRNYFDITRNPKVVRAVSAVFDADWNRTRAPAWTHQALVLSPGTSVTAIVGALQQPGNVEIEDEEMGNYRPVVSALERKGRQAWLLMPSNASSGDRRVAQQLVSYGVHVRLLPKRPLFLHAKLILGADEAYIGSENLTKTSLEKNREIGFILHNPESLKRLGAVFHRDWSHSEPL